MRLVAIGFLFLASTASAANLAETQKLLDRIKAVSKEGTGNQEAQAAWKDLVAQGGDALFPTLTALNDASPVAANWLRSAVNALVEKEKAAGKKLPADQIEAFVKDAKHSPISRRLAYEILVDIDPKTPERLLPGMLDDPSGEIRRDAVAAALKSAEKLEGDTAKKEYQRLFAAVRDQDQAEAIVKALDKFGEKPDVKTHFGIVTKWMLTGPFDSTKGAGFTKAYEPEKNVDLSAKYTGKNGAEFTWKPHVSTEPYGKVDLNKALEKHKDAVGYAYTIVESAKELPVEFRFGCVCAIKVFVNGKELFAREEYHHGDRFDQYVAKGSLKPGKNEILVKVCQNNQTDSWAQAWQFQFRIADATGGAVPVKVALANQ
jgi:hypothetical protein